MKFTGFQRGMGLGGWLTNYKRMGNVRPERRTVVTPGDRKHFASYISEWDIRNIKAIFGVDHIRLCFDQVAVEDYSTGAYIEEHLQYIDQCLAWCEAAGLNVILNLHHAFGAYCDIPDESLFDDDKTELRARFVKLWEMLEERYSGKPRLVFELLNEPTLAAADSEKWNILADETIAAIRRRSKQRVIMTGGVCWNNPESLADMRVYDDENIVYTFHFYAPHIFTHQRSFKDETQHYSNYALSYPSDQSDYDECLKFTGRGSFGQPADKEFLRAAMKPVDEWIAAHPDKILYLGEFGVISCADIASRENWIRDAISLCGEKNIPFCLWNYLSPPYDGNRFSLVDDIRREILSPRLQEIIKGGSDMKNYIHEPARQVPVKANVDVLVAGAGPAGVAVALAAARHGARAMLVEQAGSPGGIATIGLMSNWGGSVRSRMYDEIVQRSADVPDKTVIHPEKLKAVLLEMLAEAGVLVQTYTFACGAVMDGGAVRGVITESKSGREAILAKVVVDATGDGDIAAKTGAEFIVGRESDNLMQPATLMFKIGGVDEARAVFPGSFETMVETEKGELQALARERLPHPAGHVLLYRSSLPGVVTVNMTNCTGIDGTKAEDLTRAEFVCRGQIGAILDFLREYAPGYENCYLHSAASLIGVRETRHFKGIYTLTEEDILAQRVFDDWVVRDAHFNFDVHSLTGPGLDETGSQKHFPEIGGYTIPYRCLVPEKIDGLLLAGRNISGTHMAHSNYRVMSICTAMGEAAGTAAALAAREGIPPRRVDPREIQEALA